MAKGLHFEKPGARPAPNRDKRTKRIKSAIPAVLATDYFALRSESERTLPLNSALAMRHGHYISR